MRKLIFPVLLFLCGFARSQIITPITPTVYGSNNLRLKAIVALHIPEKDSTLTNSTDTSAQIFVNKKDAGLWYYFKPSGFFRLSPFDSMTTRVNLWQTQTITGQKIYTKTIVATNGIISGSGQSTNILHRENLTTAISTGIGFVPNNVSTISNLDKTLLFIKDTLNITSDTAQWRGISLFITNGGTKMGKTTGFYYNSGGSWTGQEVAFGNKRGRNAFNDSSGLFGIGISYDLINAKLHVRNTKNSGNAFLVEDSTGTRTLLHADSVGNIGIGGKSSTVAGIRIGRTVAIDSLTAGSSSDSVVTVKNGILGKIKSTTSTLSSFLPYIQTATYTTMIAHITANPTITLPDGTTTAYRKYLVINDYEADGTGDGNSSEYLYAKDKDGNPLLQKIARYTL